MMNVLHTSDWHLGKKLFKFERTQEHQLFLDWLKQTIKNENIDVLIVAGDIFDSPNPPNSAQKMFYDFIYELGQEFKTLSTVIIAGNHDSASLLEIPKYFFEKTNCYMYSHLEPDLSKNELVINKGNLNLGIKLLPYFRNFELLNLLKDQQIEDFFKNFFSTWNTTQKLDNKMLVAHHGFGQYSASGSEQAIHLSGLEYFPLEWIRPYFDYTALGHIHKRQKLSETPPIVYPGSPLPLRFSESNQKYVSLYRFSKDETHQKYIEIPIFRKLLRVKSDQNNYLKLLAKEMEDISDEDLPAYLEIEIKIDQPLTGLADNIRQFIQNKNMELVSFRPLLSEFHFEQEESSSIDEFNIYELFENFYKVKFPEESEIPPPIYTEFKNLVEEIKHEDSQDHH